MAGDWIKIRLDLTDDPNVFIMSDLLSIDCPTIVGHLVMFWGWMDRHTPDGKSLKLSESVIDKRVGLPGFASALRHVGWLEGEDMALEIPKFERHNGASAKARALESEAKRLRRKEKNESAPSDENTPKSDVGHASDKNTQKSPTREEKRREDKKIGRFTPPTLSEVTEYCRERSSGVDPVRFVNFYESKGWLVGKAKMRDWKAAVRNWERRDSSSGAPQTKPSSGGYTGVEI